MIFFKRGAYINIVEISHLYKYTWWDDMLGLGLDLVTKPGDPYL